MTTTTQVTIATVNVGEAGLAGLRFKVDKLNKRAKRHGMVEVTLTIDPAEPVVDPDTGYSNPRYDVTINGCEPCINGWYLAARVEFNDTVGTVVHVVPGRFADCDYSAYRENTGYCDHCNTLRRRNDVFVLARPANDADGQTCAVEFKVVGRNCLADFIRSGDADSFARYAEFADESAKWNDADLSECAYEEGFGGRGGEPVVCLERFLSVVRCCTRRMGWTSRTAAREYGGQATCDDAFYVLFGRRNKHWHDFIERNDLECNPKDTDIAVAAIEWAKSIQPGDNEYKATINTIATAGQTDGKLAGYAASIIRAYEKDQEWAAERAEKEGQRKEKDYIGEEGKRFRGEVVTVKGIHFFEGNYGVTTIVRMEAEVGDKIAPIVWFASGERDYDVDTKYKLDATVKGHDDDPKYGKQTKVNRCKLIKC